MPESLERYLDAQLDDLKQQGVLRSFRILEGPQGARARIDGQDVINLSSNNYLGLTNHPRLKQAAIDAIEQLGVGSGAVRTIIGTMAIHEELERRLAEFKRTEATLVLQSGFTANAAVLGTILADGDLVISDELNHASIIDGIRLTKAARRVYAHADTDALEQVLKQTQGQYAKTLIVTDGVFSMDGDIAPLDRIAALAQHTRRMCVIDHGNCAVALGQVGDPIEWRDIAIHAEDTVGDNQCLGVLATGFFEHLLQGSGVVMLVNSPGRLGEPNAVDDRGMVKLVANY